MYIEIPDNYVMVSFDLKLMFSNISKNLVINSLNKRKTFFKDSPIPYEEIISATKHIYDNMLFTFNDKIYSQEFGSPMGSPISPIFAEIVMDDLESQCLKKLDFKPVIYLRFVDDILTIIPENKVLTMLNIFNSHNEKIQFTCEIEENNYINFLDLTLYKENNKIITNWYKKPTFSGRILNFNSNHPLHQKIGMIYNLIDKSILLSDKKFHNNNIQYTQSILQMNDYPRTFIEKYSNKRIHMHNNNDQPSNETNKNKKILRQRICTNKPKVKITFKNNLYTRVKKVVRKYDILPIAYVKDNFSNIIKRGKDKSIKENTPNAVYRLQCADCVASYVGEAKRILCNRLKDHKRDVEYKRDRVVPNHCKTGHKFDWEKTSILDIEPNIFKRHISEMLHINLQIKPVNKKEDTKLLHSSYSSLIQNMNRKFTHK